LITKMQMFVSRRYFTRTSHVSGPRAGNALP
jgi:hypothetical protein